MSETIINFSDEKDAEQRVHVAIEFLKEWSQYDGDHHKSWVIDQVMRILTKTQYKDVIADYERKMEDDDFYEWEVGVAP